VASRPPLLKYHQTWSQGVRTGGCQAVARTSQRSETRARRRGERGGGEEEEDDEDEGKEKDEEEAEAEGDEDRDVAPRGPRCMDPKDPATRNSCPTSTK
jgi:hypothetical protein